MARPVGVCRTAGHVLGENSRCRICAARKQAERAEIDYVRVERMLRNQRLDRDPTDLEILVAARELRPYWDPREDGRLSTRLGVTLTRMTTAQAWAHRWGVQVPSLAEVRFREWHEEVE